MNKVVLNYLVIAVLAVVTAFTSCNDKELKEYTVTFNAKGGNPTPNDTTVTEGNKVNEPVRPKRLGWSFTGWYTDSLAVEYRWNFDEAVSRDMTLNAGWTKGETPCECEPCDGEHCEECEECEECEKCEECDASYYTVTYMNDGNVVNEISVADGAKLFEPMLKAKDGYIFDGWYTDNNTFISKWDFSSNTVTGDVTLYAKWIEDNDIVVKLLESITYNDNEYEQKFEYDNQNRISKILEYNYIEGTTNPTNIIVFSYIENDLVKLTWSNGSEEYVKNGNKITVMRKSNYDIIFSTIDLNDDELPTKYEESVEGSSWVTTWQYQGRNLVQYSRKETTSDGIWESSTSYKYGNNKSYYNCNTPKWIMFFLFDDASASQNNVIEKTETWSNGNGKTEYEYEFDKDGYPTKQTSKWESEDCENGVCVSEAKFSYK